MSSYSRYLWEFLDGFVQWMNSKIERTTATIIVIIIQTTDTMLNVEPNNMSASLWMSIKSWNSEAIKQQTNYQSILPCIFFCIYSIYSYVKQAKWIRWKKRAKSAFDKDSHKRAWSVKETLDNKKKIKEDKRIIKNGEFFFFLHCLKNYRPNQTCI